MNPGLLLATALAGAMLAPRATALRAQGAQDAQGPRTANETPKVVRYGKWGAAALFVAFTSLGVREHGSADASYRELQSYCLTVGPCAIGPDGRYANPDAEARYQSVVRGDRSARTWLLGGQIALGGAAALFVVELLHDHGTRNIPYSGLIVAPGRLGTTHVGWRVAIGH